MSYTRKPKVFKVTFGDGHEFEGLSITTRGLSVADFADLAQRLSGVADVFEGEADQSQQIAALRGLTEQLGPLRATFADALMSWDMTEEDGTPTPATLDGINLLEDMEFLTLVGAWVDAIGGVSAPLGKASPSGGTSPVLSGLMEPLSVNPPNSFTPNSSSDCATDSTASPIRQKN
jgi:hypothetical protein